MPTFGTLVAFAAASITLLLIPGPAIFYIVNRSLADGRAVAVMVEDTGRGIPPVDLDRVFGKFTRLGEGDGRPAGTGLGLAIAKGVVEAMGGSIRAESPAAGGRGTRILVRLPVPEEERDGSHRLAEAEA